MSAKDCILGKAEAGTVDPDRAREAADLFDEMEAENAGRMGAADASARAGQDAAAALAGFHDVRDQGLHLDGLACGNLVAIETDTGTGC
jgi:hypothetical protein